MEVEVNEENESMERLYIDEVQGSARRKIQSDLLVNNIPVTFKLDAGAECNVMSMHLANELNAQIEPTSMLLESFGEYQSDAVGKRVLDTRVSEIKDSASLEYCVNPS